MYMMFVLYSNKMSYGIIIEQNIQPYLVELYKIFDEIRGSFVDFSPLRPQDMIAFHMRLLQIRQILADSSAETSQVLVRLLHYHLTELNRLQLPLEACL